MVATIKKLYYSIGEVSQLTEIEPHTLRYWETVFPNLAPSKNRAGNRIYREKDVQFIRLIKYLLYEKRYTIEGARKKLKELPAEELQQVLESGQFDRIEHEELPIDENERLRQIIRQVKQGLTEILELLNNW